MLMRERRALGERFALRWLRDGVGLVAVQARLAIVVDEYLLRRRGAGNDRADRRRRNAGPLLHLSTAGGSLPIGRSSVRLGRVRVAAERVRDVRDRLLRPHA